MASPYDIVPGKIFIGGISPVTTQETIQNYFGQFGELCDCVLMQDKATGKSRGFGFVTYKDSKVIDKVLSIQNIIDGKEVDCKRAVPRDQQGGESTKEDMIGKTRKLFVGGLPQTTTEEQFRAFFEQFGKIEDSVIMADKETGKSRGFGFVTFDSEEAVERVIQRYYDNKIDGKWVECKRAQPKDMGPSGGGGKKVGGKFGKEFGGREGKQGSYQDTPSSHRSGRSQTTQDPYGEESYSGGYNMMREQGGYGPNANYPQNFGGYPPGYGNGYDPSFGYNAGYPVDYGNPYSAPYNNSFGGGAYNPYSGQYPGGYMGQGYPSDPMASGSMGNYPRSGAHSGSNYGQAGGYDPSGYGYGNMQGGYGGPGANGGAAGGDTQNRGTMSGMSKNSPSGSQDGQQGVGPVKGSGGKKQGHESRYYTPY